MEKLKRILAWTAIILLVGMYVITLILAIVEVDGTQTKTLYIRKPFTNAPDQGACSVNYEIADLMQIGEIEE